LINFFENFSLFDPSFFLKKYPYDSALSLRSIVSSPVTILAERWSERAGGLLIYV
jgi:hypothetical protein